MKEVNSLHSITQYNGTMKKIFTTVLAIMGMFSLGSCKGQVSKKEKQEARAEGSTTVQTAIGNLTLPAPYSTESATKRSSITDWPEGVTPKAPEGFTVTKFAYNLENPRNSYQAPNGDIFVAESNTRGSADRITVFRDEDKDGTYETRAVFLEDLNQPYGMLILNNYFYVANTDGLYRYPYTKDALKIDFWDDNRTY